MKDNLRNFATEKSEEIIRNQKPMDTKTISRVKNALSKKGIVLEQSADFDKYLIRSGKEAVIFSDGMIVMHTKVSASGFYEELIHYGQIKNGRAIYGDEKNMLLMEIEAKERLIRYQKAYKITDYEVDVLQNTLNSYKIQLEELSRGGA